MRTRRILSIALALLAVALLWPLGTAGAAARPELVTLDVRGLDIDNLLQFYSRTFGLTVIKDPSLTGPVTIMCPEPVTPEQAFDILNAVLGVRGFTSVINGNVMKVVPLAKAITGEVGVQVGRTSSQAGDTVITQIIPLRNGDAVQLRGELAPLITAGASIIANGASNTLTITDYASNIVRILQIIDQLDSESSSQTRVFPLTYAQASDVVTLLTQQFFTPPRTTSTTGARQQPGFMQRLNPQAGAAGQQQATSTANYGMALADVRTNSILVTTSKERMESVAMVIAAVDRPVEREGNVTIIPLRRANATDVANALNQALGGRTTTTGTARTTTTTNRTATQSSAPRAGSSSTPRSASDTSRAADASADAPSTAGMIVQAPPGAMPAPGGSPSTATITVELPSANVITLSGSATVVAEPNSNSLIVTATPENAAIIRGLVAQLDQAPPQVLIEAIIAEVALDKDSKLGFEWNWTENPAFGNSSLIGEAGADFGLSAITSGLSYAITGANWSSLLKALKTDKNVTILSTPRIFTSNNRPAEINISTQTPYVSSVVTTDNTQTFAVEYLDVGVILQVTPQISPDGMVTMDVTQEASELLGFENLGGNARAPTVANRSAQATVRVMDGQTVILGGIISSNHTRTVNKVPLLGDLPLVGSLFRHSDVSNTKSELLVFLTPRVVRTPEEATALAAEQRDESIAPVPPLPGIDDVETPDADDMAPEADAPEE